MRGKTISRKKFRRILRAIRVAVLKILIFVNFISLLYWVCWIDAIISWQPYVIMAINFGFLVLVAYANGWFYDSDFYEDDEEA